MLYERYPMLEVCRSDIEKALEMMIDTYQKGVRFCSAATEEVQAIANTWLAS